MSNEVMKVIGALKLYCNNEVSIVGKFIYPDHTFTVVCVYNNSQANSKKNIMITLVHIR